MSIRTVTKALAGKEDLLLGNETHVQSRGGKNVEVTGLSAEAIPHSTADSRTLGSLVLIGTGSPEGLVVAEPGTLYLNQAGGGGSTLYVKEANSDSTGWVAK